MSAVANSETVAGTFRTWRSCYVMSVHRGQSRKHMLALSFSGFDHSGHQGRRAVAAFRLSEVGVVGAHVNGLL